MMKLYIPTSTLNFNNILSSESISPRAFYAKRGFGYSRWNPIPENGNENVITLYDKAFSFNRPASDTEDHPMLVEIQTDENLKAVADGVYYCDHTIYLSPWRTRFIFFTEQDQKVALSLSESSLETKMLRLYQKKLKVEQCPSAEWPDINLDVPLNEQAIEQDQRTNKMKSLLYGYYIGALLSATPDIVRKHNVLQELQNIFSAVLSSDDHTPTITQDAQIRSLLFEWHKEIPAVAYLAKQLAEPQRINETLTELLNLGVSFPNMISAERIIYELTHSTDNDNQALAWLNKERESLRYKAKAERERLNPDKEEIIINDGSLAKIAKDVLNKEDEQGLAKAWINDILSSNKYIGIISSFKNVLADDVTFKAKAFYGEQWNGCEAKTVLNNMRRYVNGSESDFQWNNLLFSSIAAVIAKGSDWEQLLAFMQGKNICDYRLAFAFYGELNGFANLTRDFTDLLLNEDSQYVASVYKEFTGQLLGVDLVAVGVAVTTEPISTETKTSGKEAPTQDWEKAAANFINANVSSSKKKEKPLKILKESDSIEKFLQGLQKCDGWKRSKKLTGMKELLLPQSSRQDNQSLWGQSFYEDNTQSVTSVISSSKIQNEKVKNISRPESFHRTPMFNDRSWWNETADMISDKKARKQYLTDVEWFIENHNQYYNDKKKGRIKGYYYEHPTENARLLERFRVYLQNKLKPNPRAQWVAAEYAKVPIKSIIKYLTSRYAN